MDKSTFVLLYKAMVRPHLEYSNSVWCPFKKGVIENIEKSAKVNYILKEITKPWKITTVQASNFEI